jgi:hypothetical protein
MTTVYLLMLLDTSLHASLCEDAEGVPKRPKQFIKQSIDRSTVGVFELSLRVTANACSHLTGSPQSPQYAKWLRFAKLQGDKCEETNELANIYLRHSVKGDDLTVTHNCQFISSMPKECKNFMEECIHRIVGLVLKLFPSPNMRLIVAGDIRIYGIGDPMVREQLTIYWKLKMIEKLWLAFGAPVKFEQAEEKL